MTETADHLGSRLQDVLDGRLDAAASAQADAHLAVCETCRRELAALRWTRARTSEGRSLSMPDDVRTQTIVALDEEDRHRDAPASAWPSRHVKYVTAGLAAAAVLLLALWYWLAPRAAIPVQVARDYRAYVEGSLRLDIQTGDVTAVEDYFRRHSLPATRVFDLVMMNYRVTGGRAHELDGRPAALFAYAGAGDDRLVCEMYEGSIEELPAGATRREHQGIDFRIYRDADVTIVFWQETSDVVCVLVGSGDPETVIQLAVAKAVEGRTRALTPS
jgi:hypothetical protein